MKKNDKKQPKKDDVKATIAREIKVFLPPEWSRAAKNQISQSRMVIQIG